MANTFNLFIKDFTHLDGAILDPQRGPIGLSYVLGIEFIGEVSAEGILFDFSSAKKLAKKVVDSTADHALIVPESKLQKKDENTYFIDVEGVVYYEAPRNAFYTVSQCTENEIFSSLERLIFEQCKKDPECASLQAVKITYTKENEKDQNYYHYTHGLKHDKSGKCSRLIHGHRSMIEIYVNGVRSSTLEKQICDLYHDKHFVFKENIVNVSCSPEDFDSKNENYDFWVKHMANFIIKYTDTLDNNFYMIIPRNKCVVYQIETTVENISLFTSKIVKQLLENSNDGNSDIVEVRAYEGVEKGSIYINTNKNAPSLYLLQG